MSDAGARYDEIYLNGVWGGENRDKKGTGHEQAEQGTQRPSPRALVVERDQTGQWRRRRGDTWWRPMASGEDEVEGGRSKRRRVWREENLTGGLVHVRGLLGLDGWMGVSKTGGFMDMLRRRLSESDCAKHIDCHCDEKNVMSRSRL